MNEHELAKKIAGYLNRDSNDLDQPTLQRLQSARKSALATYGKKSPARVWAPIWANGSGYFGRYAFRGYQFWVPVLAVVAMLSAVLVWQGQQHIADQAEIDAALLAGDLPLDAYINNDFNQWVRHSLQ